MSIFLRFIDISSRYVDGADMYRKRAFLITSWRTCIKNRIFYTHQPLQHPAERLMQQRLLQFVEGGKLALVEGFEAVGFFVKRIHC